ncbi:hypothetical protein GCM10010975_27460 [Comamonas phosphati]|nr:hypothetical protein GCM10010975_27460 [Comamonas phosphati]
MPNALQHRRNRTPSIMKTAMAVLLTSAAFMLPAARAAEGHKDGGAAAPLSKGEIKAQQQFKMLDFNRDGKLSRSEVALIPKLAAAFDETDTNKDGYVTYEEVRAFAVKYRAREQAKAATAADAADAADAARQHPPANAAPPATNSEATDAH